LLAVVAVWFSGLVPSCLLILTQHVATASAAHSGPMPTWIFLADKRKDTWPRDSTPPAPPATPPPLAEIESAVAFDSFVASPYQQLN